MNIFEKNVGKWVVTYSRDGVFRPAKIVSVDSVELPLPGREVAMVEFELGNGERRKASAFPMEAEFFDSLDDAEKMASERQSRMEESRASWSSCSNCGGRTRKGESRCDECNQVLQGDD